MYSLAAKKPTTQLAFFDELPRSAWFLQQTPLAVRQQTIAALEAPAVFTASSKQIWLNPLHMEMRRIVSDKEHERSRYAAVATAAVQATIAQDFPQLYASYQSQRSQRVARLLDTTTASMAAHLLREGAGSLMQRVKIAAGFPASTPSEEGVEARILVDGLALHVRNQLSATWQASRRTFVQQLFSPELAGLVADQLVRIVGDEDGLYAEAGSALFEACQKLQDELECGPFRHSDRRIVTLDPALKNQGIARLVLANPAAVDALLPDFRRRTQLPAQDAHRVDALFLRDLVMMKASHQAFTAAQMCGSLASDVSDAQAEPDMAHSVADALMTSAATDATAASHVPEALEGHVA